MGMTNISTIVGLFDKTFSNDRVSSEALLTSFPLSRIHSIYSGIDGIVFELHGKREGQLWDTQRTWLKIKSDIVGYQTFYNEANVNGKNVEYSFGLHTNDGFKKGYNGSASGDNFNIYHWLSQSDYKTSTSTTKPTYSKMPDITAYIKYKDTGFIGIGGTTSEMELTLHSYDSVILSKVKSLSYDGTNITLSLSSKPEYTPDLIEIGPWDGSSAQIDFNQCSYVSTGAGGHYILPVSVAKNAGRTSGVYGTVGSTVSTDNNHPTYRYFNDMIAYTLATAPKPTNLKWDASTKLLSWSAVTNATSYWIYIDNEFYTSTSSTSVKISEEIYGNHKLSVQTRAFGVINNYYREYSQGYLTPTSSLSSYTTMRKMNVICYDPSDKAVITANFPLQAPSITIKSTNTSVKRNSRTFYVSSNTNKDSVETLYYKIDNGNWTKTTHNTDVTISNISLGTHTIYAYADSSDGSSSDSTTASSTFTTTIFNNVSFTTSSRGSLVDSWNVAWSYSDSSFAHPDSYNLYLNGVLYERNATPSGETVIGLLYNTNNKIEIEAVFSGNTDYNSKTALTITPAQLPILETPIITELPSTYENIEIVNADGSISTIQSKTVLNFSFTKVNRAVSYEFHDLYQGQDIGGAVLDPVNARFSVSLSNAINPGEHKFYITATAGEDKSGWDSAPGNFYVLPVVKYLKPSIIKVDSNGNHDPYSSVVKISANIDEEEKIDYFKVIPEFLDGENNFQVQMNIRATNNEATINLYNFLKDKLSECKFNFTVYAMSYDSFRYEESISSASTSDGEPGTSVIYETIKLATPTSLHYNPDTKIFDWSDVENVYTYHYDVKRDSVIVEHGDVGPSQTSVLTELDGDSFYQFLVSAKGNPITSNPKYIDSEIALLETGVVQAPTNFRREGSRIYWDDSANANNYNIYKNGEFWTNTKAKTFDMSNLGLGTYVISIRALRTVTTQSGTQEIYSNEVFLEEFTIRQLAAPTISFQNSSSSKVNWSNVANAAYFILYYGPKTYRVNANVASYSYVLTLDQPSAHNVYVEVYSNDEFLYRKNISNTLVYEVIKLPLVENIRFHSGDEDDPLYDQPTLTWSASEGANGYLVSLNGTVYTSPLNSMILTSDKIKYDNFVTITATDIDRRNDSRPRYLDSEVSEEYHFGKLQTPILVLTENVVSWKKYIDPYNPDLGLTDYTGADYFEVYDTDIWDAEGNTLPIIKTIGTEYVLSSLTEKTFKIYVAAFSDNDEMSDSEVSDFIVYSFIKLRPLSSEDKFSLSLDENNILSWDIIPNADYYEVYVNDYHRFTVTSTTCDITSILKYGSGEYEFTVIAKSNKINYLPSDPSYVLRRYIVPNFQYSCVVEDETFALNTPINLKFTASEELDTGNISFLSNRKDEYKAYTPINITLYPNKDYDGSTELIYNMLIEKDHVKEIQQGTSCVYEHNITLIELTKKLQTEFISGLAITQPLPVVQSLYKKLSAMYMSYSTPTNVEKLVDRIWFGDSIGEFAELLEIYGWGKDENMSLKSSYRFGEDILLPYNTGEYYLVREKSVGFEDYLGLTEILKKYLGDLATDIIIAVINYLLIPAVATPGFVYGKTVKTGGKALAAILSSAGWLTGWVGEFLATLIFAKYKETRYYLGKRKYQLVPYDENITDVDFYNKSSYSAVFTKEYNDNKSHTLNFEKGELSPGTYDLVYTIESAGVLDQEFTKINLEGMYDYTTKSFKPFKVVFRGISIGEETLTDEKSIPEALARVIKSISPRYIDGAVETKPEYTLDVSGIPSNMVCPQYTFKDNKSLWEVLLTIGRNFNGIPRLKKNNVISFDILSEMSKRAVFMEDSSEPEEIVSDMDNYASGFISNVSNLTSDITYDYFPSKEGWITPRSVNIMDPAVTKNNMGIVLPQNINFVQGLWIKLPSGKEYDISEFLYEKTVFNALNNNKNGKGTAIYYERGTNMIQGLGTISENTEFAATIGTDDTNYAIVNILNNFLGNDLSEGDRLAVQDYQYRVKYKPLINTRLFTEQANLSDMPADVYMNFNQDDSAISDSNFGKSAQIQVSRIGNNNIYKAYNDRDFNNMNSKYILGSIKEYNGYEYYADAIAFDINKQYFTAAMSFSKHYNKINPRIGVSSEYRTYDIPTKDVVDRTININNYCYISTQKYADIQQNEMTFKGSTLEVVTDLYNAFRLGKSSLKKTAFYMTSLDKEFRRLTNTSGIIVPASYHILNNSISYSGKLLDNVAAGVNAVSTVNAVNIKTAKYIQRDVTYVRPNGELPIIKLSLCTPTMSELKDTSITGYDFSKYYPQVAYRSDASKLTGTIFCNKYFIEKDRRESLSFNYQLHFQTFDKKIGLGHSGLVEYLYKCEDDIEVRTAPKWYIFKAPLRNRDQIPPETGKYVGSPLIEKTFWRGKNRNGITYENKYGLKVSGISVESIDSSYRYAALLWPDTGEIILDYSLDVDETSIPTLYFNPSNKKIDYKSE